MAKDSLASSRQERDDKKKVKKSKKKRKEDDDVDVDVDVDVDMDCSVPQSSLGKQEDDKIKTKKNKRKNQSLLVDDGEVADKIMDQHADDDQEMPAAEPDRDRKSRKTDKDKKKDKKKKKKKEKGEGVGSESVGNDHDTETQPKKKQKKGHNDENEETNSQHTPDLDEQPHGKGTETNDISSNQETSTQQQSKQLRPIVESSAIYKPPVNSEKRENNEYTSARGVTLLLFYQYVEPPWSVDEYKDVLERVVVLGRKVSGRLRVAREGFNGTLTGTRADIGQWCRDLRAWKPDVFSPTEFKLTHDLPQSQAFVGTLKIIPVQELVHYGLEADRAPPIRRYQGTHLEPVDYHEKLAQEDTVVIDVRNHYEANIGRFDAPHSEWLDPKMRKSTEFPVWLDKEETREKLKNKRVLMYCTGGIRCERASALLKYKMEHDPNVKDLNIKGVYQLQGGIDKYFKEFPDGGYWKGKNYVFDRRCAHAPPAQEVKDATRTEEKDTERDDRKPKATTTKQRSDSSGSASDENGNFMDTKDFKTATQLPMGKCEGCGKPWDKYRGKRRCPTCGVPSLTCKECYDADQKGMRKLDRSVRCDLCVEQNIWSKKDLRQREQAELEQYERRMKQQGLLFPQPEEPSIEETNPDRVTRLFIKNMCRRRMTEEVLMETLPGITHLVWRIDRKRDQFVGQAWIEMESPEAAARAVASSGQKVLGRPIYVSFQPPDGKDAWPPPSSAVGGYH